MTPATPAPRLEAKASRSVDTPRHHRLILVLLGVLLAGCRPGPPVASPGPAALPVLPHWDQVCEPGPQPIFRASELLLDEDALRSRLASLLPSPGADPPEPFVEVGIAYHSSGVLRTAHLKEHNLGEVPVQEVVDAIKEQLTDRARLLEAASLRLRAVRRREDVDLELLPSVLCRPHLAHEDELPPEFLGEARVHGGRLVVPSRRDHSIAVRLHVSRTGEVDGIDVLGGNEALLARAEDVVVRAELDPALENGEPVRGFLDLVLELEETSASAQGG